jgi:hypothetical protein
MKQEKKGLLKYFTWKKMIFFFILFLAFSILPDIITGKGIPTIGLLKDLLVSVLAALLLTIVNAGHR